MKNDPLSALLACFKYIVCTFIFLTIVALLIYMGSLILDVYRDLLDRTPRNFLHDIAIIVVLVKAYRILVSYLRTHHVSIKYTMEISIIAPAVELIFAANKHDIWLNVLFALFSVATMIVYYAFYDTIVRSESGG